MSIEAIRCPGCKKLVNVANLEEHYKDGKHEVGVVKGASTITMENPHPDLPPGAYQWATGNPPPRNPNAPRVHLFDSPVWGPLLRRYFPHILFGVFALGAIVGIVLW